MNDFWEFTFCSKTKAKVFSSSKGDISKSSIEANTIINLECMTQMFVKTEQQFELIL